MEVSKITFSQPIYSAKVGNTHKNSNYVVSDFDRFQVSFKGYDKVLNQAVRNFLNTDVEVEKTFINLFGELAKSPDIEKTSKYFGIADAYAKYGFRGLLYEFWKSNPVDCLKKYLVNGTIDLAKKDNKPIFQLIHFDKFGYSKNSPNDVKLVFSDPQEKLFIQYGLNKKGELDIWQTNEEQTVITSYHLATGNKKCEVIQPKDGYAETTYYNKDGSKSFWKNFFRGGVAIVPR